MEQTERYPLRISTQQALSSCPHRFLLRTALAVQGRALACATMQVGVGDTTKLLLAVSEQLGVPNDMMTLRRTDRPGIPLAQQGMLQAPASE